MWAHISVVVDGSSTVKVFENGELLHARPHDTSGWTCVFRQTAGKTLPEVEDWIRYNVGNGHTGADFSILDDLERWRLRDGAFHLKLVWPDNSCFETFEATSSASLPGKARIGEGYNSNEWRQTSNPLTSEPGRVTGYDAVDIHFGDNEGWGGLALSFSGGKLLDGSFNQGRHTKWWYNDGAADGVIAGPAAV
jgi:hypothetical protein